VLGAGFSASLGGPMLPNLLSRRLERDIAMRYPSANIESKFAPLHSGVANEVRIIYELGLSNASLLSPVSRRPAEHIWSNAEEFIDYVDTAAADVDSPHARRLIALAEKKGPSTDAWIEDLRAATRRIIAAECSAFLEGVDINREQWRPFRRWAARFGETDTVISFNYDRIIEMLRDDQNKKAVNGETRPSALKVVLPAQIIDRGDLLGCCPVLKLHGSVDWRRVTRSDSAEAVELAGPTFALTAPSDELLVATPGPSKLNESVFALGSLWELACEALKAADVIVFVGFRFPETDAYAREQLLTAIGENNAGMVPHRLSLGVVLGHPGKDTVRLEALLRHVCLRTRHEETSPLGRAFGVTVHPLFAQDFFSVVTRADL